MSSNTDTETAHATQTPAVTIVKSSNATAATKAGDTVTFSFVVTNTGNVTITSFEVHRPAARAVGDRRARGVHVAAARR